MAKKTPDPNVARAEIYKDLVADCVESLAFLHDNLGLKCRLDFSPASLEFLEEELKRFHRLDDPNELWPDLVESYCQLISQYWALSYLDQCKANWGIDAVPTSAFRGQPFVDIVPIEPWNRFYPIHYQVILKDPNVIKGKHFRGIRRRFEDDLKANRRYRHLLDETLNVLREAREGALPESTIIECLSDRGMRPNHKRFSVLASKFPDRVGQVLRKSGLFSKRPADKAWRIKRQSKKPWMIHG